MAYYTDYDFMVPFRSDLYETAIDTCNALADFLIQHCGFTLSRYSTAGAGTSDSTNYTEVVYHGCYLRFYQNKSALSVGNISFYIAYSPNGSSLASAVCTFSTENNNVRSKLRLYNTKSGFLLDYMSSDSWTYLLYGIELQKISDGSSAFGFGFKPYCSGTDSKLYVNDGINSTYYLASSIGVYDTDSTSQILSNVFFYNSSSSAYVVRYLAKNVYYSGVYLLTNIVQINGRIFFMRGYRYYAIELNV